MSEQQVLQDAHLPARMEHNQQKVRSEFWPKLKKVLARIPFAEDLLAAYYAAIDTKTPLRVRATLLAALAYFIMPLDFLPDVLLGLGFTDDATVLYLAIRSVAAHLREEHFDKAREALARLKNQP